jgi:hypothetical protein
MRRIGIAFLTTFILGAGVATAEEKPPVPSESSLTTPAAGRFIFYPARSPGELEYMLDSMTGDLWVISRDPDTKYVYLGFIPKGPSFTFQDILRQKQPRSAPSEP